MPPGAGPARLFALAFGPLRWLGQQAILLSIMGDVVFPAKRYPAVHAVTVAFRDKWLWPSYALGQVFMILHKAAKRDELGAPALKLVNLGVVLSALLLGVSRCSWFPSAAAAVPPPCAES